MVQLLLVEDDPSVRDRLARALSERGHDVTVAGEGMAALQLAMQVKADLVILDLGLPDVDGREVLRMLRAVSSVPIIVATARDDEREIEWILDAGADDYVVKPFGAGHLDARIRAVLRRFEDAATPKTLLRVGGLSINVTAREVVLDGRVLELSRKEFDLLHYLAARAGQVVSKRELMTEVWQIPIGGAEKTIDVHLAWLRRKLGETASKPRYLRAVWGSGVKIVDPHS